VRGRSSEVSEEPRGYPRRRRVRACRLNLLSDRVYRYWRLQGAARALPGMQLCKRERNEVLR
jgi:hypothetical protein